MKRKLVLDIKRCIDCPCIETYEDWLGFDVSAKCKLINKFINIVDAYEKISDECLMEECDERISN